MFITTLLTVAKNYKLEYLPTLVWIKYLWYIHIEEYFEPIKNKNESHKHNIEQNKTETKEYILYNSTNIAFKNRQNKSIIIEVRIDG